MEEYLKDRQLRDAMELVEGGFEPDSLMNLTTEEYAQAKITPEVQETVDLTDVNLKEIPLSLVGNKACLDVILASIDDFSRRYQTLPLENYLRAMVNTLRKPEAVDLEDEMLKSQSRILEEIISRLEAIKKSYEEDLAYDQKVHDSTDNYQMRCELGQDITVTTRIISRIDTSYRYAQDAVIAITDILKDDFGTR